MDLLAPPARKVDVRLPVKGNSNTHGARPVHLIITMIKWIRTSRLSIKNTHSKKQTRVAVTLNWPESGRDCHNVPYSLYSGEVCLVPVQGGRDADLVLAFCCFRAKREQLKRV